MGWQFLRDVDDRTNAANSYGYLLVCYVRQWIRRCRRPKSLMPRKANELSEIYQVYFKAGWKELTEVMNCLISSLLDEVAPMQSSMKRL